MKVFKIISVTGNVIGLIGALIIICSYAFYWAVEPKISYKIKNIKLSKEISWLK